MKMKKIKRNIKIEITLTPEELAAYFWGMSQGSQAAFFNHLGKISDNMLCMQLQYVTDCDDLTHDGRHAMRVIGEYSDPYEKGSGLVKARSEG